MNERIKQLALKAFQPINDVTSEGVADRRTFNQVWFEHYNQNFAKLIVAECAQAVFDTELDDCCSDSDVICAVSFHLKKHFGVEL